ncbi:MAG: CvpA family protein [Acidobacteriaceae bacterium]|nr:CvpA family protein [Acidobacteriaceae bacterium]
MTPLNWFDIVIIAILVSSALSGLRSGLARVVVGLIATIVGFLAGFWSYGLVGFKLAPYVHSTGAANFLGFLAVFCGTLLIGALVGAILSRLLRWVGLSWLNHAMGGLAGIVRGVLLIAIMVSALVAFTPSPPPDFLNNSRLLPYASQISTWLADAAPKDLKDAFDAQMKSIRRLWTSEQLKRSEEI